jgi:hypothetical protein
MDWQELIRYVSLLRYDPSCSQSPHRVLLRIEDIDKIVRVSPYHVSIVLKSDTAFP